MSQPYAAPVLRRCKKSPRLRPLALAISILFIGQAFSGVARAANFPPVFNLSGLDGSNGFRLNGAAEVDYAGVSVSGAGDINGDGLDDLIVGAMRSDNFYGSSFVVFGTHTPFPANLPLSSLDGTAGFRLNGPGPPGWTGYSGSSVSAAGDINGDGVDDMIIGAPLSRPSGTASGSSLVFFGRNTDLIFRNGFD